MSEPRPFFVHIPPTHKGARLDKALAALLPAHSRATIQRWLKQGAAFVDGEPGQQTQRLRGGERVYISPRRRRWPIGRRKLCPSTSSTRTRTFW